MPIIANTLVIREIPSAVRSLTDLGRPAHPLYRCLVERQETTSSSLNQLMRLATNEGHSSITGCRLVAREK